MLSPRLARRRPLDRIRHHAPGAPEARCSFSIIVPAYNEQLLLEDAVEQMISLMGGHEGYEIVIVEDGCSDYTPVIAAELRHRHPNVQHIHSDVRLGKGRAVAEGMRIARGDVVVLMDADMATDPRNLLEHVRRVESGEADVVVGSRYHPRSNTKRAPLRLLYSRVYNAAARFLLGSRIRDHQCGFKIFDKRAMRTILPFVKADRFFWDTEVLAIAQWFEYRVQEVPIVWREGAASKVRLFRTPLEMFSALVLLAIARRWRMP